MFCITLNSFIFMSYRKFIVNVILSIVALYLFWYSLCPCVCFFVPHGINYERHTPRRAAGGIASRLFSGSCRLSQVIDLACVVFGNGLPNRHYTMN